MSKMQIFRISKIHNIPAKDIMALLKLHRVEFKTSFSSVDKELAERILARKYHIKLVVPKPPVVKPKAPVGRIFKRKPLVKETLKDKIDKPVFTPAAETVDVKRKAKRSVKIEHTDRKKSDTRYKAKRVPIVKIGMAGRFKKRSKRKSSKIEKTIDKIKIESSNKLIIYGQNSVAELASNLSITPAVLIKELLDLGIMATKNDILDKETMIVLSDEYEYEYKDKDRSDLFKKLVVQKADLPEDKKPRPPVVTVMGHVDHGKTTLLDTIRNTRIADKEAGGITQDIGASVVEIKGKKIVFIDTPGHKAFTQMRARGAQVTDLVVLVVAADDGIMPQSIEAINHAKSAGVPILVAINKIDKPNANSEIVKKQLSEHGLVWEKWGGDTVIVEISAKKNIGVDKLLEMIILISEMAELKSNPDKPAKGIVIESKIDSRQGTSCTVLIKEGTLNYRDYFVAGKQWGRVRRLLSATGKQIKVAGPSTPVMLLGITGLPEAGDILNVVPSDKIAKTIAASRQNRSVLINKPAKHKTLESLMEDMNKSEEKSLKIIIKSDTVGASDAFTQSIDEITGEIKVQIIHSAVGAISETDLDLADATGATILGFNVSMTQMANRSEKKQTVDIKLYKVIYEAIDDIKNALAGMLTPVEIEKQIGVAEVRQIFKISKIGTIAGSYVTDGKIMRGGLVHLVRNGVIIYTGKISNLKRFKEDAKEVGKGYECGISIAGYNDIKVEDSIEAYILSDKSAKKE